MSRTLRSNSKSREEAPLLPFAQAGTFVTPSRPSTAQEPTSMGPPPPPTATAVNTKAIKELQGGQSDLQVSLSNLRASMASDLAILQDTIQSMNAKFEAVTERFGRVASLVEGVASSLDVTKTRVEVLESRDRATAIQEGLEKGRALRAGPDDSGDVKPPQASLLHAESNSSMPRSVPPSAAAAELAMVDPQTVATPTSTPSQTVQFDPLRAPKLPKFDPEKPSQFVAVVRASARFNGSKPTLAPLLDASEARVQAATHQDLQTASLYGGILHESVDATPSSVGLDQPLIESASASFASLPASEGVSEHFSGVVVVSATAMPPGGFLAKPGEVALTFSDGEVHIADADEPVDLHASEPLSAAVAGLVPASADELLGAEELESAQRPDWLVFPPTSDQFDESQQLIRLARVTLWKAAIDRFISIQGFIEMPQGQIDHEVPVAHFNKLSFHLAPAETARLGSVDPGGGFANIGTAICAT